MNVTEFTLDMCVTIDNMSRESETGPQQYRCKWRELAGCNVEVMSVEAKDIKPGVMWTDARVPPIVVQSLEGMISDYLRDERIQEMEPSKFTGYDEMTGIPVQGEL